MKRKFNIKLELSNTERKELRKNKVKIVDILEYSPIELSQMINISEERATELYALANFQRIPTIGIEFAKDLVFLGYYSINELSEKDGGQLTDAFEKKKGYKTDPCVEDQFRLAVHFAKHEDYTKNWWDFTEQRKRFRTDNGYPSNRPQKNWTEVSS